jgi:serine/threonine-protein kinase
VTPERWQKVRELFHAVLELDSVQRASYLDVACSGDLSLRKDVETLISSHGRAGSFLEVPALAGEDHCLSETSAASTTSAEDHGAASVLLTGQKLGRYQIMEKIGSGGMGVVYRARDERLDRAVALKVLPAGALADESTRKPFREEALALARLSHAHIAAVYDFDSHEGIDFLVTEFIPGTTLAGKLADATLPEEEVVRLGIEVASALEEAHEHRVLHCDLKPGNIMMTPKGQAKVLDFGLARLLPSAEEAVRTDAVKMAPSSAGTPPYMAPEQLCRERPDARTDIWALGVVLYEMACGRLPFPQPAGPQLIAAILNQQPDAPRGLDRHISPALENVILTALEKNPESRYQSAKELGVDLRRLATSGSFSTFKRRPGSIRRALILTVLASVLLAAAMILNPGGWRERLLGKSGTSIPSIAVLPFNKLSEQDSDYFSDGLTDEIISNLSIIDGLQVRSRTSSFAFKDRPRNVHEVGAQLGVNFVLEGSVLRSGDKLRINAQLVRVSDDVPLWSQRFEREMKDVFAIQDEISRGIVNSLRLKLGRGRRRYETSVEAYELYLRARTLNSRTSPSASDYQQRITLFEEAIARDPSFAPAYAGLAAAYARLSIWWPGWHPPDELANMRATAEKAIQLDPLSAEAHSAQGMALARDGQWEQSEKSFRRAIEIDPNRSETYSYYYFFLLAPLGRIEEAVRQMRVAEKADPLSPDVHRFLAHALIYAGRYSDAADYCMKLPADYPTRWQDLARARLAQGRTSEAIQMLEAYVDPTRLSPQARGLLGYAYARSGRREEAEKMASASQYANEQALIFAGLGDRDRTLEALDRMAPRGAVRVGQWLNFPELAFLRGDPRVKALRKKVGLPE